MKGWHGVQVPLAAARSTLTLTVILSPPSRLHPPRLTLTLGLTGPWRVRGRATLTQRAGGLPDPGPRARRVATSWPSAVHAPCAPVRQGAWPRRAQLCVRDIRYGTTAWAKCRH